MPQNRNDRYEADLKKYKFAIVILASVLFVVIFALTSMISDISAGAKKEPVVTTTTTPPVTTTQPRVEIKLPNKDTSETLIVVNNENHYTLTDTSLLVELRDTASYRKAQMGMYLRRDMLGALEDAFSSFVTDMGSGEHVTYPFINEAYRDFETQKQKYENASDKSITALPGGSDLHSGYSFLLRFLIDGQLNQLNSWPVMLDWLNTNMPNYGFIDRYPATGNTDFKGTSIVGYGFYRYVGLPHSVYIAKNAISLEDYISLLKSEYSVDEDFELDELLTIDTQDGTYYVMYVTSEDGKAELSIPQGCELYSSSVDNMGGFVVTLVVGEEDGIKVGDGANVTPEVQAQE